MILVDSDVLIAHLRSTPQAREWLRAARRDTRLAISTVTIVEIAGGMRSGERREVVRLLTSLDLIPITDRIAWKAAEFMRTYRRSHGAIGTLDYLIAATAQTEGLRLATLNVRHYPMFEGLAPPFSI